MGQRRGARRIQRGKAPLRNLENFNFFEVRGGSRVLESCLCIGCVGKVWGSVSREAGGGMRSLRICLMIKNFFQLCLGHNYRGCKGIYFLAMKGRPRGKLLIEAVIRFSYFCQFCLCLPCSFRARRAGTRSASPAPFALCTGPEKAGRQSHGSRRA